MDEFNTILSGYKKMSYMELLDYTTQRSKMFPRLKVLEFLQSTYRKATFGEMSNDDLAHFLASTHGGLLEKSK